MRKLSFLVVFQFIAVAVFSQSVGIGTTSPNKTAKVDISSTTQGFLPPRMTHAQRNAIVSPAQGLIVYCTDCGTNGQPQYYNGTSWRSMDGGSATNPPSLTVTICNQTWMTQNLNVNKYRNGDTIPQVKDSATWLNLTTGAWCWYNNDSATYAASYGRLYNWYAVTDPRGLAPTGYHVPSDLEWNVLIKCIDPTADTSLSIQSTTAGGALKEAGTLRWLSPNTGATNSSGFTALPGGLKSSTNAAFLNLGSYGYFWTTSESSSAEAKFHRLFNQDTNAFRSTRPKTAGLSVRCIKD